MNSRLLFMSILFLVACATQVSSDIYLPSLVSISKELSGANFNLAQLSIPLFLVSVSISQLFFGPLSEGIGRKKPLQMGLIIMTFGSLLCLTTTSISGLLMGRFVQGIGAGALTALWRTVFRDVLSGTQLAKQSSFISVFMIFVVSSAPALGGYFETIGWRLSFVFMTLYTLIALVTIHFGYTETNTQHHRNKLKLRLIISHYQELLASRVFLGTTLCVFLSYGGLFSWIVVAPALLMQKASLSSVQFGWVIAMTGALGYSLAAIINGMLVNRLGMSNMMSAGWLMMILSGLSLTIGYYFFGVTVPSVIIPILIFYFGSTWIWPNAFATAFSPFGHIAGFAGSLYGFMQLVGGGILGSIVAHLPDHDQRLLGLIIIMTSLASLVIYRRFVMPMLNTKSSNKTQ